MDDVVKAATFTTFLAKRIEQVCLVLENYVAVVVCKAVLVLVFMTFYLGIEEDVDENYLYKMDKDLLDDCFEGILKSAVIAI